MRTQLIATVLLMEQKFRDHLFWKFIPKSKSNLFKNTKRKTNVHSFNMHESCSTWRFNNSCYEFDSNERYAKCLWNFGIFCCIFYQTREKENEQIRLQVFRNLLRIVCLADFRRFLNEITLFLQFRAIFLLW